MQLYAFDLNRQVIEARQAKKHQDYFCLECQQIVRMRGGLHRRSHFYHREPTLFCRQHQKGPVHLQLQSYFLKQLPIGDCQLEYPFPSIGRIADVAWFSKKVIFEIQCSPISAEEVLQRNSDYEQQGWKVIWILHDQRYNQIRLSAAEMALRSSTYFFSNMNEQGIGMIYDQFDLCNKGVRIHRLSPLSIDITQISALDSVEKRNYPLYQLTQRTTQGFHYFQGDLVEKASQKMEDEYLKQARKIEKDFYSAKLNLLSWNQLPAYLWQKGIAKPYLLFFQFLLERICR